MSFRLLMPQHKKIKIFTLLLLSLLWQYTQAQNEQSSTKSASPTKQADPLKWKFQTNGKLFSSPKIADGTIYIGSEDKNLYAIDEKTGQQKWKFLTGAAVHSSAAIADGIVYFSSFDGFIYAVDAKTGQEKWKFKTGSEQKMGGKGYFGFKPEEAYHDDLWDFFLSSPVVQKNVVYAGSSDGNVYALNAKDGSLKWKHATGNSVHSSPAIDNNTLYIGSWDTYLYALDTESGAEKWKFKTGDQGGLTGILANPAIRNGIVYIGARDGFFYALNSSSGDLIWKYSCNNSWIMSSAAFKDDLVYFGTSDTYLLLGLDQKTGKEKFSFKSNGYLYSSPLVSGTTLFIGDFTGKMFAVDLNGKGLKSTSFATEGRKKYAAQVLKNDTLDFVYAAKGADLAQFAVNEKVMNDYYKLGAIVSTPAVSNKVLFFGSADGYLYALKLK